MDDALLSYYNRELAYLRQQGAEFAERHPRIAGRLRLDRDLVEDPHVSRLIEGFAFLTARIRQKLDDSFPELTEALMGVLYPDYHAPVPSLCIAQIHLLPERLETRHVAAGETFYTRDNPAGTCLYRSCYDTTVYPMAVSSARFSAQPFQAPPVPATTSAGTHARTANQAVLRIDLRAEPGTTLAEIAPPRLRFYLHGQPQLSFRLYEWLLHRATAIVLAKAPGDPAPHSLAPAQLRPRGLYEEDAVLPAAGRSATTHRLLTEYFAFPEKFLFVELEAPDTIWEGYGEQASLYIYFDQAHPELIQGVSASSLLLGCVPVVNLFEQRIACLYGRDVGYENRVTPEPGIAQCADIHSLLDVYAEDAGGTRLPLQPFFASHRHEPVADRAPLFWHLRREVSHWHRGRASRGIDTFIAFVDSDFTVTHPQRDWIIGGRALCTNRDLPDHLPFGPDQPAMQFLEGGAGLRIRCVTAPTATLQPAIADATRWQLVAQLSLQHFDGPAGLDTLKELLRLYDFRQIPQSRAVIEGITGIAARTGALRIARGGRASLCQGTLLELELDEQSYSGAGLYLFTAVLSECFAHFCTLNTFVQLSVKLRQRPGILIAWPPRSGYQALI